MDDLDMDNDPVHGIDNIQGGWQLS